MYVEKIYPNLQDFYNQEGLIYPQDMPNKDTVSPIVNKEQTFETHEVEIADNTSNKLELNEHNSLNNTYKLLENMEVESITRTKNLDQKLTSNACTMPFEVTAGIICILASIMVNPLFTIGIALFVILYVKNSFDFARLYRDYYDTTLQNISINLLLAGIKNSGNTNNISQEDYTELLTGLNNAVNSDPERARVLLDNISDYNWLKRNKNRFSSLDAEIESLIEKFKEFSKKVFNDASLISSLNKLGFNVSDVQNNIYKHIEKNLKTNSDYLYHFFK